MHAEVMAVDEPLTVAAALAEARSAVPANEARLLLQGTLGCSHARLAAHPEKCLRAGEARRFREFVARRVAGEPVAYILGEREFYGRPFLVTPAVLIPRPETELLAELALAKAGVRNDLRILDLGTGSGVLAITLALELPGCEVVATDVSPQALAVARTNALRLGARVRFAAADWYGPLARERFDLIVSNPPYVAHRDSHLAEGDLRFEPPIALSDGSDDGLDSIRAIVAGAVRHLRRGGWLLVEHGYDQARACRDFLSAGPFSDIDSVGDLSGIPRVTVGRASVDRSAGHD